MLGEGRNDDARVWFRGLEAIRRKSASTRAATRRRPAHAHHRGAGGRKSQAFAATKAHLARWLVENQPHFDLAKVLRLRNGTAALMTEQDLFMGSLQPAELHGALAEFLAQSRYLRRQMGGVFGGWPSRDLVSDSGSLTTTHDSA